MGIAVNNISKSYKKIKAVENISFNVNDGELFGLIGPDGAGKTTIVSIRKDNYFQNTNYAFSS